MLLRDLLRQARDAAARKADGFPVTARYAAPAAPSRAQWFGEEHRPEVPAAVALWGNLLGLVGWDEGGNRVVEAPWPGGLAPVTFVESSGGWLYGVFVSDGLRRDIKRFRPSGRSLVMEPLLTLPSDLEAAAFTPPAAQDAGTDKMLVAPDGTVYVKVWDRTEVSGGGETKRPYLKTKWMRLVESAGAWSLVDEVESPTPTTDHWDIRQSQPYGGLGGRYDVIDHDSPPDAMLARRFLAEAILRTGRWVAADPIPSGAVHSTTLGVGSALAYHVHELQGPTVLNACMVDNLSCGPGDLSHYVLGTVRIWGDAWWERTSGAWSNVVNGGLSTNSIYWGIDLFGALRQGNSPPSSFAVARKAQAAGNHLPMHRFKQNLFTQFPYDDDVPHQIFDALKVDGSYVYLALAGVQDFDGNDFLGSVWRAPIPGPGAAPTGWTKVLDATSVFASLRIEVTKTGLWVADSHSLTFKKYTKSGEFAKLVATDDVPSFITTAFKARWQ